MRKFVISLVAVFILTVCGAQAEAHIPAQCTNLMNATSNAVAQNSQATKIATNYALSLVADPTSPTALAKYFAAAQKQAVTVSAMLKANERLMICIATR